MKNEQRAIISQVLETVSFKMGVSIEEMKGKKRYPKYVIARHLCMYLLREMTSLTFEEIGNTLNRNHSTTIYGIYKIKNKLNKNKQFRFLYYEIKSNVNTNINVMRFKYSVESTTEAIYGTTTLFMRLNDNQRSEYGKSVQAFSQVLEDVLRLIKSKK